MTDIKTGEPYINIWFGNFYKPAYDDKDFIKSETARLKELGFNSILLDSKDWEDFRERFRGGAIGQYVAQQEYMMEQCRKNGISYNFLSLYLCADNLYPNIRFSPPVFGESVTNPDGSDGRWYKYWSDKAKDTMTEHTRELLENYGDGMTAAECDGREVFPTCTMWDPIVAPSFDAEGRERYLTWLRRRYGDIDAFNAAYGSEHKAFEELKKEDYWYDCAYPSLYTEEELRSGSVKVTMWADNMRWRIDELCEYFADMQRRIHEIDPRIFTMPDMAQWSYFLNVDASQLTDVGLADLWDTSNRGIDIYKLAKNVDCCHFITVPVTPYGDADIYVSSCQHSMMRAMNKGRDFIGGIFWGRFLYNDIYEFLSPCETVGTMVAAGVGGYTSYGLCGLDDGGLMHRMDEGFCSSLKTANEWAKKVIPRIRGKHVSPAAILFPSEMSAYEPMGVGGNKERRYDLLGWYRMCCDFGLGADVIDMGCIERGDLDNYELLIVPENDCYFMDDHSRGEAIIRRWTECGGTVIHSPADDFAKNCFGIESRAHEKSPFVYGEKGLIQSDVYRVYGGETVAEYTTDGAAAISETKVGKGAVFSFGFAYGYCYSAKIAPHVPLSEKNNELYPVPFMKYNMLEEIAANRGIARCPLAGKNIETAEFDNCMIVVNHNSYPIYLGTTSDVVFQYDSDGVVLMPRSAAAIFSRE